MISEVIKNTALTTKVHGKLKKNLKHGLSQNDYQSLIELKDITQITAYLKYNTNYGAVLSDINENYIHRGQLESLLRTSVLKEYMSLSSFMPINKRRILRLFKQRQEIEKLKIYMRLMESGHTERFAAFLGSERAKYEIVDFQSVMGSTTFPTFLEAINKTVYYKILHPLIGNEEHFDIFTLEMALDMYYNKFALSTVSKNLTGVDKLVVKRTLGTEIDLSNIAFILRSKKYYNLANELIFPNIIPNYYKISRECIREMVESETTADIFDVIEKTHYKNAFPKDAVFLENDIKKFSLDTHKKMFRKFPNSIAAPLMYIHVKHNEIQNIIAIIEGIRYGWSGDEIKSYLSQ